jgi:hypothetical protein
MPAQWYSSLSVYISPPPHVATRSKKDQPFSPLVSPASQSPKRSRFSIFVEAQFAGQTYWHLIGYSVGSPSIVMHMPAAESGQAKHYRLATGFVEVWLQDTGALPRGTKKWQQPHPGMHDRPQGRTITILSLSSLPWFLISRHSRTFLSKRQHG